MTIKSKFIPVLMGLLLVFVVTNLKSQDANPLEGAWDLVINQEGKELPSWLEVSHSGTSTFVGRFVYASGSARPIAEVKLNNGEFSFAIPPQWESGEGNLEFKGKLTGKTLTGTMRFVDGKTYNWSGVRAPKLEYNKTPTWGSPVRLIGNDLKGWKVMGENQWKIEDGVLISPKSGANLVTEQQFTDFNLHVEFRYPEGSNSGLYLRGRYEVQIADNRGMEPSNILFAGIYGFLTPNEMMAKAPGEWQQYDITLIGRRVTIVANGVPVIIDQNIPGITGGALDSREGEPGPIMIQGDHGPIELRNMILTPIK